jgi:hypothetical protein
VLWFSWGQTGQLSQKIELSGAILVIWNMGVLFKFRPALVQKQHTGLQGNLDFG